MDVKEVTYESGAVLRPAILGGEVDAAGVNACADWLYFGEDGGDTLENSMADLAFRGRIPQNRY